MKVSYNWLKSYLDFDLSIDELSEWLTALGLEVEGVETFESIPGGLKGVVTGEILTCDQHPNADRLRVTTVNVGGEEALQVVCGAPNVAAGQKVLVATVGTSLPAENGETFEIKKSKIRGEVSEGMICAEDELGLGTSHDGIMVLPEDIKVGIPASEMYEVETDTVYEIGLTPNRSDATSQLGSARDLAAGLGYNLGKKLEVAVPKSDRTVSDDSIEFTVEIRQPEACPRYSGLIIRNLQVGESPNWMKNRLKALGVRPINNVVDITNFVLHEFGQPLHAFDLEKVKGNGIVVDYLPEGSKFVSLDENERTLTSSDLMICDAEMNPMCIGGVFGGINSGVTDSTTQIFLESAHFDAEHIRRTSMHHNLRTDAAKVFEKGSDPNITDEAVWRAANLMKEYCGAQVVGPVFDIYPKPILKKSIAVRLSRVNQLIGIELTEKELEEIFNHLQFEIENKDAETYHVLIPTDKSDVLREADVIEEVLRIYGYDNVDISGKLKTALVHVDGLPLFQFRNRLISRLTARGFHQMMNLSLSKSAYYPENSKTLVPVLNTSNSHLDIMRPDMLMCTMESVNRNVSHQNRRLKLFEFGNIYSREDGKYMEQENLCITVTGDILDAHWSVKSPAGDYFALKSAMLNTIPSGMHEQLSYSHFENDHADFGQEIHYNGKIIGQLSKVSASLCKQFDIEQPVYIGVIDVHVLYGMWTKNETLYESISKFPGVQRDLALVVNEGVAWEEIEEAVRSTKMRAVDSVTLFDIYRHPEHLGEGKKSLAIRFDFIDHNKTLNDKQVDKMIKKIISVCEEKLHAQLR